VEDAIGLAFRSAATLRSLYEQLTGELGLMCRR
jgi:hypothetical protein